jgi:hypothetical protein
VSEAEVASLTILRAQAKLTSELVDHQRRMQAFEVETAQLRREVVRTELEVQKAILEKIRDVEGEIAFPKIGGSA